MERNTEKEKMLELRSEEVQEVMGKVPPVLLRWGITVLTLVVVTLLVVSYLLKYPDTISGPVTFIRILPTVQLSTGKTMSSCTMLIPAQGSGKVHVGQRTIVRVLNFPDQEFGYLEGRVEHLSDTPDSNGRYVVHIRFDKGLVTNYGIQLPNTMQMQGSAEIITEDIRLIVRFFEPLKKILSN